MAAAPEPIVVNSATYAATTLSYWGVTGAMIAYFRGLTNAKGKRKRVSQVAFLIGCLIIGGGTVAFTAAWGIDAAALALAFSIALALAFADPVLAVIFLAAGTLLRPWELLDIPAMAIIPKLGFIVCLFAWFSRGFRTGRFGLVLNGPVKIFIAFFSWVLLSALLGGTTETALTEFANSFLISSIVFMLIVNIVDSKAGVVALRGAIVAAAAGVIGVAISVTIGGHRLESQGMFGNSNDLAALIVLAMPLLVIPRLGQKRRGFHLSSLVVLGVVGMMLWGLWEAQSRGAFIGLFAAAGAYVIGRSKRPLRGFLTVAALTPILYGVMAVAKSMRASGDLTESTDSRLNFMLAGVNMALHFPVVGAGFSNFPKMYQMYAPGIGTEFGEHTAHSTWVLAMAETGFPGFFLIAALFLVTLKAAWKVRGRHPELFPAMVSYGIAITFLSHTYIVLPYLLFGLVLVAAKLPEEAVPVMTTALVPIDQVPRDFMSPDAVRARVRRLRA